MAINPYTVVVRFDHDEKCELRALAETHRCSYGELIRIAIREKASRELPRNSATMTTCQCGCTAGHAVDCPFSGVGDMGDLRSMLQQIREIVPRRGYRLAHPFVKVGREDAATIQSNRQ